MVSGDAESWAEWGTSSLALGEAMPGSIPYPGCSGTPIKSPQCGSRCRLCHPRHSLACFVKWQDRDTWVVCEWPPSRGSGLSPRGFPLGWWQHRVLPGSALDEAPGGWAEVWQASSGRRREELSLARGLLGEPSSVHLRTAADLVSQTDNHWFTA